MKNTKKKVLVGALVLSLAAIVSVGSIAWYSASSNVQNKFFVASSTDPDPDKTFSIKVIEKTPSSTTDDPDDDDGYEYDDVFPGTNLVKAPYVKNTGTLPQYVRVVVKVSDASALKTVYGITGETLVVPFDSLVNNYQSTAWLIDSSTLDAPSDTMTYVFYANDVLEADAQVKLFDGLTVPDTLDKGQVVNFTKKEGDTKRSFTMDIKAQAVQTKNLGEGDTVAEKAKSAFETVGMELND